jgi:hypothetical protein
MPPEIEDRYLGDGVYAHFDGYHIVLDLRQQDSTTRIGLEPAVLHALNQFKDDIVKFYDDRRSHATERIHPPVDAGEGSV